VTADSLGDYPLVDGTDVTHSRLDAFGLEMHVASAGPEDGPVVLLLHGFPEVWLSCHRQLPVLANAGYRVIAPDLRGYWRTVSPAEVTKYSLLDIAGDLVGLLHATGVRDCVVAGQDWGSPAATTLALCRPDLLKGIVLFSTPYSPRTDVDFLTDITARLGDDNYQQFFQEPGIAESIFEADVRATVIGSLLAVSGDAPQVHSTTDVSQVSEVPEAGPCMPAWLSEQLVNFGERSIQLSAGPNAVKKSIPICGSGSPHPGQADPGDGTFNHQPCT
jgi:pimeloyl-ACP methyl ester carboxylesterase